MAFMDFRSPAAAAGGRSAEKEIPISSPIVHAPNKCSGICTRKRRKDGHTSDIPKRQASGAKNDHTLMTLSCSRMRIENMMRVASTKARNGKIS